MKWLLFVAIVFAGVTLIVLAAPRAAIAGERTSMDQVVAALVESGEVIATVPAEQLTGVAALAEAITGAPVGPVTRAFIAQRQDGVLGLGLEVGGCLLDPIELPEPDPGTPV